MTTIEIKVFQQISTRHEILNGNFRVVLLYLSLSIFRFSTNDLWKKIGSVMTGSKFCKHKNHDLSCLACTGIISYCRPCDVIFYV